MKKSVKAHLALAVLLCGMGVSATQAQSTTTTTTTSTTASDDGATGTDPVPTRPSVVDILLIVLQTVM